MASAAAGILLAEDTAADVQMTHNAWSYAWSVVDLQSPPPRRSSCGLVVCCDEDGAACGTFHSGLSAVPGCVRIVTPRRARALGCQQAANYALWKGDPL